MKIEQNAEIMKPIRKTWVKPEVQVVRMKEAAADLSLHSFDGILFQSS